MKKVKSAIFAGDSFTWGEGLQLYINDEYWINQRNLKNDWPTLKNKCTIESELFRENNRFAGLVSKQLNIIPITYKDAGVLIKDSLKLIEDNLYRDDLDNKFIIYQFTTLDRLPIHINFDCNCESCGSNFTINELIINYMSYLSNTKYKNGNQPFKIFKSLTGETKSVNPTYKKVLHYEKLRSEKYYNEFIKLLKEYNIEINLNNFDDYTLEEINIFYYNKIYKVILNKILNEYFIKWSKKVPIYFISSWMENTNKILNEYEFINKNIIELIGYDNNLYKDYTEWEKTFPHISISEEFVNTGNYHPTFLQHQYISKSIINHLEKCKII